MHSKLRWLAMSVFVLLSLLNYLDRQLLGALAPFIREEFHLDNAKLGWLIGITSIPYALASPFIGYLMDGVGLNIVTSVAVGIWSLAGAATGLTTNFAGLMACRFGLAVGESAGIPAVAKAGAMYLPPGERALGSALSQVGLGAGLLLAANVGVSLAVTHGWRFPFFVTGALGLFWIPLWLTVSRFIRPAYAPRASESVIVWDRNLVVLMLANVLWMGLYSLWNSWLILYLVDVQKLSPAQTIRYSWVPPVASTLGGLLGGWFALRFMKRGEAPIPARLRVIFISALGSLLTVLVPLARTPAWAVLAISVSFFWALAGSVNIYVIPIDLYGPERAGFATSALVFAYGLLQFVISPLIGNLTKHADYRLVCWIFALPPLLAWVLLKTMLKVPATQDSTGSVPSLRIAR